jgi:hypothetical protein
MAKLRKVIIDGTEYLLPEREIIHYQPQSQRRGNRVPVSNEGFAVFVEISILALLFAAHVVLISFS